MKKITHASIRREISTRIAPKGTVWIGQVGDDYNYDQTKCHRTATAAAHEIIDQYNSVIDDDYYAGREVRVINVTLDNRGCATDENQIIIIREGWH